MIRSIRRQSGNPVGVALCVFAIGLAFTVTRSPTPAAAQTATAVHEVEVGKFFDAVPGESMAFYPSSLRVHSGDVLHFTNEAGEIPETGTHGVLALPPGERPQPWQEDNARNLDGEWATFLTDPDDEAGAAPSAVKLNWKLLVPTDLSCGTAENPCITGTSPASRSPFSSGISFPLDFYLKVEAEPGTQLWILCPIHMNMKMKLDVVADSDPATSAAEVAAANEAKLARDAEKAARLHRTFSNRRTSTVRKDGTRVWDAWPGIDRGTVSLFGMYPKSLAIKRNDSVKWRFGQLSHEIHSVTFPLTDALDVNNAPWLKLMCDPDTDEGEAPDLDPGDGPCPAPPSDVWEFDLHPRFYFPAGNRSLRGDEYESSGIRGAGVGVLDKPYTMRFPQHSGKAVWEYACQLHPTMRGAIKVR